MIEGEVRVRKSIVTASQTNGEPNVKAALYLEGFKDDAHAHKCLRFIGEKLLEFEGQKKLDDKN